MFYPVWKFPEGLVSILSNLDAWVEHDSINPIKTKTKPKNNNNNPQGRL